MFLSLLFIRLLLLHPLYVPVFRTTFPEFAQKNSMTQTNCSVVHNYNGEIDINLLDSHKQPSLITCTKKRRNGNCKNHISQSFTLKLRKETQQNNNSSS